MKIHELQAKAYKKGKRVGRGISAGQGKTAGRGTKGQGSRTGKKLRAGFEGGQNPLMRKFPKLPGFKSLNKKAQVVYTGKLDSVNAKVIDVLSLHEAGLIASPYEPTRLIVKGEVTKAHKVMLQGASEGAITMLQKAGGSFEKAPRLARAGKVEDME
jgi:large subunit ribosomal protein L15